MLEVTLDADQPQAFYRLRSVPGATIAPLGLGGAQVIGYAAAFAEELDRIGQIAPDEFAARFPNGAVYLAGLSWDPTTAQFWDQFATDPEVINVDKQIGDHGYRMIDTRLDAEELKVFRQNGFVVSEPLSAPSFANGLPPRGGLLAVQGARDVPAGRIKGLAPPVWTESYRVPYRPELP